MRNEGTYARLRRFNPLQVPHYPGALVKLHQHDDIRDLIFTPLGGHVDRGEGLNLTRTRQRYNFQIGAGALAADHPRRSSHGAA